MASGMVGHIQTSADFAGYVALQFKFQDSDSIIAYVSWQRQVGQTPANKTDGNSDGARISSRWVAGLGMLDCARLE
eukprot:366229-Chlamydomonas_euryale.AAC.7